MQYKLSGVRLLHVTQAETPHANTRCVHRGGGGGGICQGVYGFLFSSLFLLIVLSINGQYKDAHHG